jgi:hypothetical protein
VRASPERPGRDGAGQAMAEYVILLALMSAVNWVDGMRHTIAEAPLPWVVGAAVVVVVGLVFRGAGRS